VIKCRDKPERKAGAGYTFFLLRGINRQTIIKGEENSDKLLKILGIFKAVHNCTIYAYCFMHNHVYLLICTCGEDLASLMIKLGA